ncbi:MAG: hypothetical protein ACOYVE_09790 [Melioribacter sp.]|uniref:hypothetical protein n=1 Tax=Melioribacter sp. TaxID=2052167 RepID=UPI003BEE0920
MLLFLMPHLISAQFYFFGRNKVQYESFKWKLIKTEHFNIYYYDNFERIAEIGARFAEESFEELKVKFNHYVTSKIPLIFYNSHIHFQQTNTIPNFIPEGVGGFFEFLKGRVVIPYPGSLKDFRHVIKHELVHVFMTNKIFNLLRDHRIETGRMPPLWFVEGLAEYWSYEWDAQGEMIMRDFLLNNMFIPLEDLSGAGGYIIYKEGQSFLEFIAAEFGEDKILFIIENMWRFNSFYDNLEYSLGLKIKDIGERWEYYLKKKYYPLYESYLPHFIGARKLTDAGLNFNPRIFNKDGEKEIYFIGNHNGYSSVFKLDYDNVDHTQPEVIIEGEKEPEYESFHLLDNTLDLSEDGLLAFITKSKERDVIHLYSVIGNNKIKTLGFENLISIRSPKFSNDGKRLLFSATDTKAYVDIYMYDLEKDTLLRLTNDYYADADPVFDKEGKKVIFCSDRTSGEYAQKFNLFELDLSSYAVSYITNINANIRFPRFSPDYKTLYFNCDYDGVYNIWRLNNYGVKKDEIEQLTKFVTSVYSFDFVDDTTLVTSSFEKLSFQFYELNISASGIYDRIASDYTKIKPAWKTDGISSLKGVDRLKYDREYTLDYAVGQLSTDPIYGSRGGALFAISDLLGDDRYIFYFYNSAELQSEILDNFNIALSRINLQKRSNYGYGIFHFAGRRYDIRESEEFFYERVYGGFAEIHYPFSVFQRLEASVSLANSDKELFGEFMARKALLMSNTLSFVHDNALWASTGPIDGSRFRIMLGYISDIKFSNLNYYSVIADYRKYFRIGYTSAVALRGAIFINHGKEARRFFAGGSWDLRGWPRWSIRGEKLWLSSVELRFPLIDRIYIKFPFFGLGFAGLRGALFFDSGAAWDSKYKETLGSVGFGFRLNLFNVITLRYDIGKKIENNFSRFQDKLFYQFFFGWDF